MGTWRILATLVLIAALGTAAVPEARAQYSNRFKTSVAIWHAMDRCKRNAWREHPDYTRADEAARERSVKQCLATANLPPDPLSAGEPQPRSGSSR